MTSFFKDNGQLSSIRTPFTGGYFSNYPGSFGRGGVTFTSRLGASRVAGGQVIGTRLNIGKSSVYFRNGRQASRLTQF